MELPVELQCHVWQLLYNGRLQHVHKELKEKVELADDSCLWYKLRHRKNKWKRRQDSNDWIPNVRKQSPNFIACDDLVYLNSCKKCFVYKNYYYASSAQCRLITYKFKKEAYESPWN